MDHFAATMRRQNDLFRFQFCKVQDVRIDKVLGYVGSSRTAQN